MSPLALSGPTALSIPARGSGCAFSPAAACASKPTSAPARRPGAIDHLALDVDDIESAWEEVRMAGLAPLEDAIQFLPFWENGVRFFNLLGPNGETVEFSQRL
jgi:catechol 2,3-dioxygenase-like lactoylglutathione lyase family enzyme